MDPWLTRGPLPLPSTLNEALQPEIESVLGHMRVLELETHTLVPIAAHVSVSSIEPDMPTLFARAMNAEAGPLVTLEGARDYRSDPGLLCILPEPLVFGVRAVAIHQGRGDSWHWDLERLDVLTTNPETARATPEHDLRITHVNTEHRIYDHVPTLSSDERIQKLFSNVVSEMVAALPDSYDVREELVPGITTVFPEDGNSLRTRLNGITAYHFVTAAIDLGLGSSIGKGLYKHVLWHIGNRELAILSRTLPQEEYEDIRSTTYYRIEETSKRSGEDILRQTRGNWSYMELVIDFDVAHDLARAVRRGREEVEGLSPNMKKVLASMFE